MSGPLAAAILSLFLSPGPAPSKGPAVLLEPCEAVSPGATMLCSNYLANRIGAPHKPVAGDACRLEAMWQSGVPITNQRFYPERPVDLVGNYSIIVDSEIEFDLAVVGDSRPAITIYGHHWLFAHNMATVVGGTLPNWATLVVSFGEPPPSHCGTPIS